MSDWITADSPLTAADIIAFDEEGNDLALAAELAAMTPEQRAQTEANVRAFIAEGRANLRPRRHGDGPTNV